MKRQFLGLLAAVCLFGLTACSEEPDAQPGIPTPPMGPGGLGWYRDYHEAKDVAQRLGQPLFIAFTDPACEPCVRMENEVFPTAEVKRSLHEFTLAWLEATARASSVANLRLMNATFDQELLPLYVVIDPETREELGRLTTYAESPAAFVAFLDACLEASAD